MSKKSEPKTGRTTVPLTMPEGLSEQVEDAAERIGLSKQDTMRLALARGLPVLLAQLEQPVEAA